MVTKAMIMSAGVGSRLDPLTKEIPKPLVPIANIPTMDILLNHLAKFGINNVIANTHYLGEQIQRRYSEGSPNKTNFSFVHEETLSGTAGGVKKCQFFFDDKEDFLVLSADGLTELDLDKAIESHIKSNCIATMVTKEIDKSEVNKFGVVVTDESGFIKEFQEKPSVEEAKSNLINTGIYIFKYDIFKYIPENTVFDFAKNLFPLLLENNIKINTYTTSKYWSDIGSISQYIESTVDILTQKLNIPEINIENSDDFSLIKDESAIIEKNSKIKGNCIIGKKSKISENAHVENSILWDNVVVDKNVSIKNCVIASNCTIKKSISNKIVEANSIIN